MKFRLAVLVGAALALTAPAVLGQVDRQVIKASCINGKVVPENEAEAWQIIMTIGLQYEVNLDGATHLVTSPAEFERVFNQTCV